jgi:hypothetical protein
MYVLEWCRYKSIDIVETEIIWLMNEVRDIHGTLV